MYLYLYGRAGCQAGRHIELRQLHLAGCCVGGPAKEDMPIYKILGGGGLGSALELGFGLG